MKRFGCLAVVAVLVGVPVVAARVLPPWGTLALVLAEAALVVWAAPRLLGFGIQRLATRLVSAKSLVLDGAEVLVHTVREVPAPAPPAPRALSAGPGGWATDAPPPHVGAAPPNDDDDEPLELDFPVARHVLVDCTITPRQPRAPMQRWEPTELRLVPWAKRISLATLEADGDADEAVVVQVTSVATTPDAPDPSEKVSGPQRVQLVFACPAALQGRVKLRYYLHTLGDLTLPTPSMPSPASSTGDGT